MLLIFLPFALHHGSQGPFALEPVKISASPSSFTTKTSSCLTPNFSSRYTPGSSVNTIPAFNSSPTFPLFRYGLSCALIPIPCPTRCVNAFSWPASAMTFRAAMSTDAHDEFGFSALKALVCASNTTSQTAILCWAIGGRNE
ncbi:hypothetical protein OCU04_002648 [Sclerotinia nivalis]|uniref:Uncharacterized protein n=1 Tax=Sclerotinia nivalis TaxID=352851 RepID=A0A9X0AU26_9HELO|nr:hypothetical protein OCU04_002648 [Sclerotinia nivalis]